MLATGRIKIARGILYVIAQCAGAAAGSGLLKALTPERAAGKLGTTGLGNDVTELQGFGIEFFLGFILVFVVCGVSVHVSIIIIIVQKCFLTHSQGYIMKIF